MMLAQNGFTVKGIHSGVMFESCWESEVGDSKEVAARQGG
jgi:hypothetical protein